MQVQQAQQGSGTAVASKAKEPHVENGRGIAQSVGNGQAAGTVGSVDHHNLLNGCRMVRAMCLAGQCQALASAGVAPALLNLLTDTQATGGWGAHLKPSLCQSPCSCCDSN
jgi:hypothetical protein